MQDGARGEGAEDARQESETGKDAFGEERRQSDNAKQDCSSSERLLERRSPLREMEPKLTFARSVWLQCRLSLETDRRLGTRPPANSAGSVARCFNERPSSQCACSMITQRLHWRTRLETNVRPDRVPDQVNAGPAAVLDGQLLDVSHLAIYLILQRWQSSSAQQSGQ